ncbi:MAG: hypothetical protein DWC05_07170 [Candidatus Poseidoniales archaeon]|nr:MAG: hypothetical protein DWC05_07170 [Candidatus Poseidoniales archaeon]
MVWLLRFCSGVSSRSKATIRARSSAETTLTAPLTSTRSELGCWCDSVVASLAEAFNEMFRFEARYKASSSGQEEPVSLLHDHQVH